MTRLFICVETTCVSVNINFRYFIGLHLNEVHLPHFFFRIITSATERVTTTQFPAMDPVKALIFTCAIQVTSAIDIGITVIPKNIVMMHQMKAEHAKLGKYTIKSLSILPISTFPVPFRYEK